MTSFAGAIVAAEMAADALFPRQRVKLYDAELPEALALVAALEFDAVVGVNHRAQVKVTRLPVEKGADITDNAVPEPRQVTLTQAIVSNRPVSYHKIVARTFTDAAEDAWAKLEVWRRASTPLTLLTTLDTYEQVLIETVEYPQSSKIYKALVANITLTEIVTVATSMVEGPKALTDAAAPRKELGAKAKVPAPSPLVSAAARIIGIPGAK